MASTPEKTNNTPAGFRHHIRLEHLYAGVSGGVISTLILHPLDLVKIRFQVNEGAPSAAGSSGRPAYQGMIHAMKTIHKNSGFVGLYQGVTPNVWGAGVSWGSYFLFYNSLKNWMQEGDTKINLGATNHLLIASVAGFAALVLTNPIWVTKTRLCLQYENTGVKKQYLGMADALVKIYRENGVRGLYKGFVPGVFGISHGALQFMAYEELKTLYNQYRKQSLDTRLGTAEYLTFAAISKMFAATLTYPYQVVRSRLQEQHRVYTGVIDVCQQIIKFEGWWAFTKGMGPCLLRVTPACCITFVVYENAITFVQRPSS